MNNRVSTKSNWKFLFFSAVLFYTFFLGIAIGEFYLRPATKHCSIVNVLLEEKPENAVNLVRLTAIVLMKK